MLDPPCTAPLGWGQSSQVGGLGAQGRSPAQACCPVSRVGVGLLCALKLGIGAQGWPGRPLRYWRFTGGKVNP